MRRRAMSRRTLPDLAHSHGAWVVLFASVGAGALVSRSDRGLRDPWAGTACAGGYLAVAAFAAGVRQHPRRALGGTMLAISSAALARYSGADPRWAWALGASAAAAFACIVVAKQRGVLSRAALVLGLAALTMAAPTAALANGTDWRTACLLLLALWSFSAWRSLRLASELRRGPAWKLERFRARGLREAAFMAVWSLAVVACLALAPWR
jgi:hypothetical protein